jgi:hypothetical protein
VATARIIDRQLVQRKLFAHFVKFRGRRILERNPDETSRPFEILADVLLGDVGELSALLVRDAVDEHGASPAIFAKSRFEVADMDRCGGWAMIAVRPANCHLGATTFGSPVL